MKLLHDAFWLYADAAGQSWKIKIDLAPAPSGGGAAAPSLIRIDLTATDADALAAVLVAAAEQSRGGGLRVGARSLIAPAMLLTGCTFARARFAAGCREAGPRATRSRLRTGATAAVATGDEPPSKRGVPGRGRPAASGRPSAPVLGPVRPRP